MPFDSRRLARIAWIKPINMPALLELKIQAEIGLISRCDPLTLGDEINSPMRDGRRRSTCVGQRSHNQYEQREKWQACARISHFLKGSCSSIYYISNSSPPRGADSS